MNLVSAQQTTLQSQHADIKQVIIHIPNNFGPINKLAGKLIEIPWDSKEIIEATYIADTLLCISVTCFNVIDTSKLFQNK